MTSARGCLIGDMDTPCHQTQQPHDTVIGYVRVSSQDQADGGISLGAQRHRLQAYCAAHDLTLARVEEDAGISARKTTNRPALQRALRACRRYPCTVWESRRRLLTWWHSCPRTGPDT